MCTIKGCYIHTRWLQGWERLYIGRDMAVLTVNKCDAMWKAHLVSGYSGIYNMDTGLKRRGWNPLCSGCEESAMVFPAWPESQGEQVQGSGIRQTPRQFLLLQPLLVLFGVQYNPDHDRSTAGAYLQQELPPLWRRGPHSLLEEPVLLFHLGSWDHRELMGDSAEHYQVLLDWRKEVR